MGTFAITDDFYLNGEKFKVISGSIHYFRVVPEYWRDRLTKLKNMGCNTVETYLPWNGHEPKKGQFRFDGLYDVEKFVRLAQELGLWVILRPSPYICAEWEFGGLPAWLLKEDGMRLRCNDPVYLAHVQDYYRELLPRLAPLQITHGGPVLMMQVENEYGSYGDDKEYLSALRDMMRAGGMDVPPVTSDGPEHDMLACGHCDGVFQTGNFGSQTNERFDYMAQQGLKPLMCMEFWDGWFDHWGHGAHARTDAAASAKDFGAILDRGHGNLYMFHGGTSFGLMNGANYYDELTPDVTSYDYDAPLSEDGRETEKYRLYRAEIEKRFGPVPQTAVEDIPRRAYGAAKIEACGPLLPLMAKLQSVKRVNPCSMERLGQDYGYILYRKVLVNEAELRSIRLVGANDRAHILLDGQLIATMYDHELEQAHKFEPPVPVKPGAVLEILVENMGRVNYSYKIEEQRKGIDRSIIVNNHQLYGWEMVCLDEAAMLSLRPEGHAETVNAPSVHHLTFEVDEKADTFLALPGWGKATVFLNGFCLGRMWEVGPQKRLYIPAPLLREGTNDLLVLETDARVGTAELVDEPDLG